MRTHLPAHAKLEGPVMPSLDTQTFQVPGRASGGDIGERRLGALVLRLTSEVGAHNKIQSDRTNHRSPTGEIGGFDWTYGNWLSNELISLTPRPNRWAIITDRVVDCLAIAYFRCFRLL